MVSGWAIALDFHRGQQFPFRHHDHSFSFLSHEGRGPFSRDSSHWHMKLKTASISTVLCVWILGHENVHTGLLWCALHISPLEQTYVGSERYRNSRTTHCFSVKAEVKPVRLSIAINYNKEFLSTRSIVSKILICYSKFTFTLK